MICKISMYQSREQVRRISSYMALIFLFKVAFCLAFELISSAITFVVNAFDERCHLSGQPWQR